VLFNTGAYLFGRWGAMPSRLQPRVNRSKVASISGKEPRVVGSCARTSTSDPSGSGSGWRNCTVSGETNTPRTLSRLIVPHNTR
jgi:hypothetical protein